MDKHFHRLCSSYPNKWPPTISTRLTGPDPRASPDEGDLIEAKPPLNPADKEAGDVSKFGSDTPMKRPAQPEELAPAYVFLASSHCSSYITGEILPIVGGY